MALKGGWLLLLCLIVTSTSAEDVQYVEAAISYAQNLWASRPIRCVDWGILRDPNTPTVQEAYGDGFARLQANVSADVVAAVSQMPPGGATLLPDSALAGASVWLLQQLSAAAGVPLEIYSLSLPPSLPLDAPISDVLQYVFAYNGSFFDCAVTGVVQTTLAATRSNFLHPHVPFGYTIVTVLPTIKDEPLSKRIWSWTQPFSGPVWAVIASSMVITAFSMYVFEGGRNLNDFRPWVRGRKSRARHSALQLLRGYFIAVTTFTTQNGVGFSPVTLPGRVYQISLSMATILLFACYIANLAAVLTVQPVAVQLIDSMDDFAANRAPACVLNNSAHISFMRNNFPDVTLQIVPTTYASDLLNALVGTDDPFTCPGAVLPSTAAAFYLSAAGDPNGTFCGAIRVGQAYGIAYAAVPFSPGISTGPLAPFVLGLIDDGSLFGETSVNDFPESRPQCLAQAAAAAQAALEAGTAPPLEMKDMAGIFILHAIGLVAGYVIKITVEVKERYFPKPPKQPGAAPSPYALPHGGRNGHGRGGSHAAGAAAVGGAAGSGGPLQGGPLGSGSAVAGVGADNDVDEEEEEDEAGGLFGGERRSSVGGGMSTRAAGLVRHKVEAMTGQMEDLLHEMRQLLESDVGALGRPVLGGHNRINGRSRKAQAEADELERVKAMIEEQRARGGASGRAGASGFLGGAREAAPAASASPQDAAATAGGHIVSQV